MSEASIQSEIRAGLRKLGYVALSTSSYSTKRAGLGVSKGVPDLLVTHKAWLTGCWLGIEVKRPKGSPTPDQKELLDSGRIVIATSLDEALEAVRLFSVRARGQE